MNYNGYEIRQPFQGELDNIMIIIGISAA